MAFFDPTRESLTLRIVYDGLGTAGKTTNVRQAHALFTLARSGDVIAPAEERGRTLFFDWLELETGYVDEVPLRCQVLTVPGQFLYVQRRYELLRSADAIVLVCDSTPAGVVRSRYAARFLHRMMAESAGPPIPVIVQANKQDMPGALSAAALAAELGLEPGACVVEASAATGAGVRATLVFALQAARDALRARLSRDGLAALPTKHETPEQVYAHLVRHENDARGAMLADAVIASFLAEEAPVGAASLGPDAGAGAQAGPDAGAGAQAGPDAGADADASGDDDDLRPQPNPPPGFVWPPALGPTIVREAVARLAPRARLPRPDAGDEGGEVELSAGGAWTLLTMPALLFADETRARFGLEEMVRARVAAADLLPPSTVFVVRACPRDGRHRLWAIRPAIAPLFDEESGPPVDEARRRETVELLATMAARAVALAARHGVVLKVSPRRVGSSAGQPVFLGLVRGPEALGTGFVEGMMRWADRTGEMALAELFGASWRRALRHHATPSDLVVVGFTRALESFRWSTDAGARLVETLRGV